METEGAESTPPARSMTDADNASIRDGTRVTVVGAVVNSVLTGVKFAAGVYGHSQGLIADAVHSFSDLFTDGVVLWGLAVGSKEPDEGHHFGHARVETLASAAVGLALVATAVYLGVSAVHNIYYHVEYHPTVLALAGAGASILFKEGLYQYTVFTGRRLKSRLILANAWHHRSDALSSVAVLLGVVGARFNPDWHILDSYAALLVSFFIVKVGLDIFRGTIKEFTDAAPGRDVLEEIIRVVEGVEGVMDAHHLKVRTSGGYHQMEVHIVVKGDLTVTQGHRIAKAVEAVVEDEITGMGGVIVHVDPDGEEVTKVTRIPKVGGDA